MKVSSILIKCHKALPYVWDRILSPIYKASMKSCGTNVSLRPSSSDFKGIENLSLGNNVILPAHTVIFCTEAPVTIGDDVIFGPNPTIISGDHRTDVRGVPIREVKEKLPSNDLPVVIENDVWVGANVTILKGVTIGTGSVIAAGAVVTKSCEPYSIIGGVPAKLIRKRF